uniref:Secreted protein n=1 Tax=Heterorhabditis bacteriophora TaxID=37862 RepID=A0A1I7X0G8_HETBA
MRLILLLLVCTSVSSFKSKNPLKTKKYKCIEVADDMEIQVVSKTMPKYKNKLVFLQD